MEVYSLSEKSFEVAVRTMAEVFPNTSVWYVPGHTLLLGSKSGKTVFDYKLLKSKFSDIKVVADLKSIGVNSILDLMSLQILSSSQLQDFLDTDKTRPRFSNQPDFT